jgi:hypothetical protein
MSWGKTVLDFGSVKGRGCRTYRRDPVAKKFQNQNCKIAFFKVNDKPIGG